MGDTEYSNLPVVIVVKTSSGRYALAELNITQDGWNTPSYRIFAKTMTANAAEKELLRIQREARALRAKQWDEVSR